jgi:hypothetical protein
LRLFFIIYFILSIVHATGPVASYCDYESGYTTDPSQPNYYHYTTGNDQEKCNSRMLRSLEVLNANYAPAAIQFVLHSDYPIMLHATDPGFDGFFERATGGTALSPNANDLKEHYNIPNALNIYIVDFVNTRDGTSGISTYPKDVGTTNIPGAFFKHGFLPGDVDGHASAEYDRTLMHEIGHYLGLLHISGIWYLKKGNRQRDLVNGDEDDCNEHGDTICDTPAEPGESGDAWYTNSSNRECIFHGYNGEYSPSDGMLKIGGYNSNGGLVYGWNGLNGDDYEIHNYNYCEEWEIEDSYGLIDHCYTYTNYDNMGDFFGTKNLPADCFSQNQSEYAAECHIDNYTHLPIGHNFMRAGTSPYNGCGLSPINDNNYYDETKSGFTEEQYLNIRYFAEHCYTGCWDPGACNFDTTSTHLLRNGGSSCEYSWETDKDCENDCLYTSNQISRSKRLDSITQSYQNLLSEDNLDCATDELYGDFTDEEWDNLIKIRKKVKQMMNNNINRTILDTIYIPVVFHNLYKLETLSANATLNPINFEINRIYPNPFNPTTTIRYGLNHNANIQVLIYDIQGRVITTLIDGFQTAGYHSIIWDASKFSSGIYFLNMSAGEFAETKKLVLIK